MSKTMVNIYLEDAALAKVDRLRAGTPTSPGASRNAYCSWLVTQALAGIADMKAPRARKIIATGAPGPADLIIGGRSALSGSKSAGHGRREITPPADATAHEGARLRAARIKAGLTHAELGVEDEVINAGGGPPGSNGLSRGQVQRAERAASLDGYPALRAWLAGQAKP